MIIGSRALDGIEAWLGAHGLKANLVHGPEHDLCACGG